MKLLLGIQNKRLSHSLYSLSSWCLFDGDTWWHHPLKQQSIAFTSPTFPFESKRLYRIVLFLHSIDRFHMISSMFKHHLRPFHHISTWKRLVNRVNSPCHWVVAVPRDHEIDSDPGTLDSKHMSPHVSRHSVGPLDMDGINENIRIAWCSLKTEFSCELVNCVEEFYFHIQLANGLSTSFFRITETRCALVLQQLKLSSRYIHLRFCIQVSWVFAAIKATTSLGRCFDTRTFFQKGPFQILSNLSLPSASAKSKIHFSALMSRGQSSSVWFWSADRTWIIELSYLWLSLVVVPVTAIVQYVTMSWSCSNVWSRLDQRKLPKYCQSVESLRAPTSLNLQHCFTSQG